MTMTADVSISGKTFNPEEAIAAAATAIGRQLSPARLDHYRWLLTRYPKRIAAVLPILRLVEEEWGVIDDDGMRYAAILLDCPPSHVFGVVTFYTHLHTAGTGRFCLDVCMTLSCAVRGSGALLSHLEKSLGIKAGNTTEDGLFTIRKVECLAACGSAPMLQCGDKFHEQLDAEKVDALLESLRAEAQKSPRAVAPGPVAPAVAPSQAPAAGAPAAKAAPAQQAPPQAGDAKKDKKKKGGGKR